MVEILFLGAVVILLVALYLWTRKSEREIAYDRPGMSDEQANGLRFGIAVGSSNGINGGV